MAVDTIKPLIVQPAVSQTPAPQPPVAGPGADGVCGSAASPPEQLEAVTLRRATVADAAALALVGAATFLEAFTWMLPGADIVAHCARHHTVQAYTNYLQQPTTRVILAVTGPPAGSGGEPDAPVGYAMVCEPELPTLQVESSDLELKRIYLFSRFRAAPLLPSADAAARPAPTPDPDPDHGRPAAAASRPLRPAQALLDTAIAEALALGRTRLLLGVNAGNLRALAFYRRNRFAPIGSRTFQVGSQACCDLILARPLLSGARLSD